MGYNNQEAVVTGRPCLVFDIETAPIDAAAEYVEPVEAPANYKDPAKIDAYKAEKQAEQIARAALNVDLCRVVAIGYDVGGAGAVLVAKNEAEEARALTEFWQVASGCLFVGFNCLSFDLPVLLRRSQYLGIDHPRLLRKRYDTDGIADLADVLTFSGRVPMRSLAFYAKRFRIPTTDTIKGADIPALVADGQWASVEAHVLADVQTTVALAQRLGIVYQAQPAMADAAGF